MRTYVHARIYARDGLELVVVMTMVMVMVLKNLIPTGGILFPKSR